MYSTKYSALECGCLVQIECFSRVLFFTYGEISFIRTCRGTNSLYGIRITLVFINYDFPVI